MLFNSHLKKVYFIDINKAKTQRHYEIFPGGKAEI